MFVVAHSDVNRQGRPLDRVALFWKHRATVQASLEGRGRLPSRATASFVINLARRILRNNAGEMDANVASSNSAYFAAVTISKLSRIVHTHLPIKR